VLVANRGEIAVRIIPRSHRLGIRSAAVYSDADRDAPHVLAPTSPCGSVPAPASESYLDVERLVDGARLGGRRRRAPRLRVRVRAHGVRAGVRRGRVVFVGPPPDAIEAMGDKIRAKRTVAAAGVSVVPGAPTRASPTATCGRPRSRWGSRCCSSRRPGGGGKGMRRVDDRVGSRRRHRRGAP
jgi:acetyl-CoA/propionyl-CoA carboxylase, biotin carboxylase, biotin carboxyl carrier protein